MASVLIVLLPYLVLFYFLDSLKLVRKNHLLFQSYFGKRFEEHKRGIHFPGLSPLGLTVRSHCHPVCCSRGGIVSCNTDCSSPVVSRKEPSSILAYETIDSVTVEHTSVRVNGDELFRAPTQISAGHFADTIKRMKSTPALERHSQLTRMMRRSFRIERLQQLRTLYGKLLLPLRLLSSALFFMIFIFLPLCLFTGLSSYVRLGWLVLDIGVIYFVTVSVAYFTFRRVHRCNRGRGLLFALMLVFSPLSALHVLSLLSADMYFRFDYLTVAAALTKKERFSLLAAAELRKIQYAFITFGPQELRDYWTLRKHEIEQLLRKTGLNACDLMAFPLKQDPLAVGFCPVCLTEYRDGVTTCSDCGIELQGFKE